MSLLLGILIAYVAGCYVWAAYVVMRLVSTRSVERPFVQPQVRLQAGLAEADEEADVPALHDLRPVVPQQDKRHAPAA